MKPTQPLSASDCKLVSLLSVEAQRWLADHPEHEPYYSEKKWRIPYLISIDGGVGEFSHPTLPGVVLIARNYSNL